MQIFGNFGDPLREFPIALMIKYGDIELKHLSSDYIFDPGIKNLMNKVTMNVAKLPKRFNPSRKICPEWSIVELHTKNGGSHEKFIGAPLGSSLDPLPRDKLYKKFTSCVKFSNKNYEPKLIYEKLINIEKIKSCRELL